ncbi:hypothetical protein H2199_004323 [Coniosporium tulheliwenetii]|uniref:Uncharacterized protein n=1 Tax=Coniosporium tulheliwenetii TaxID=3383036 RepID=A0ACC2Z8G0_9PEZI|nr:hypothetical protein H2199_004323 [Cladosporium sp. JES 115]
MATAPQTFTVTGRVSYVDGSMPSSALEIRVFDVDLRSEQLLAVTRIPPKAGVYEAHYAARHFRRAEKASADLRVYVYDDDCSSGDPPLAVSGIHFNVGVKATIDIVIGGDVVKGPTEFARLAATIQPLVEGQGIEIADLVEDAEHQDISFIVGESNELRALVEAFVRAHQFAKQALRAFKIAIPGDIFYALLRQSLSTELVVLVSKPAEELRKDLDKSIDDYLINSRSAKELAAIVKALAELAKKLAVDALPTAPGQPTKTPLGELLGTTLTDLKPVIDGLTEYNGSPESFWEGLRKSSDMRDKVANLQFTMQLGTLTLSHIPLVKELQKKKDSGEITEFSDLAKFRDSDWLATVNKPGVGAPDDIPEDTDENNGGSVVLDKATNYARGMAKLLEDTFTTKFISHRLLDADDDERHGSMESKADIAMFLKANNAFDFSTTRIVDFVAANPGSLEGIANKDAFLAQTAAFQRIYSIAPQYTQARVLMSRNVKSSLQVARMGQRAFVGAFSSDLGGNSNALKVYDKATLNYTTAVALWTGLGEKFQNQPLLPTFPPGFSHTSVQKAIPDWDTLFDSPDSCDCTECNSIAGPAAYFVDILHFLRDRRLIDNAQTIRDSSGGIIKLVWQTKVVDGKVVEKNTLEVLFQRRPDLGEIQLTCENTNTPVPYIDLTLEILENYISPPPPFTEFTLPEGAQSTLDGQRTDGLASTFRPPLTPFATVSVVHPGRLWTIDEQAYTYFIARRDRNPPKVISRSLQTKGQPAELAATPQYINSAAYQYLIGEIYPLNLPFDLWTESVRTYLAHIKVRRHEVMEALYRGNSREGLLSSADIVREHLLLTSAEESIILGTSPGQGQVWQLYGFRKETIDASSAIPDPADKLRLIDSGNWRSVLTGRLDVFLQQARITYRELLNCIEIQHIFNAEVQLDIAPHKGEPEGTCELSKLQLTGATSDVLSRLIRCVRLQRKLDGWTLIDLGRFFAASAWPGTADEMRRALQRLSCIKRLMTMLGLSVEDILVLWQPISTIDYRDHVTEDDDAPSKGSQYERVFRNKTIDRFQDQSFPRHPSELTGMLSEYSSILAASLNISAQDLGLLLKDTRIVPDDTLNLQNLSRLFRHTTVIKAVEISISDYLIVQQLMTGDHFQNPTTTVRFVERAQNIMGSPFALSKLGYLLRHSLPREPTEVVAASTDAVALILDDLRAILQQIRADYTYSPDIVDDKGEKTKNILALLNWDPAVITTAVGILNDAVTYDTSFLQPLPAIPEAFQSVLAYDEATPTLSFSRVMSQEERDELSGLSPAQNWKEAIAALYEKPRSFILRNMGTFSVRKYSAPLRAMPSGIEIPSALSKKVYWDRIGMTIYAVGALTESERDSLLVGVSPGDFMNAINQLYDGPNNINPASTDSFIDDETDLPFLLNTPAVTAAQRFSRVLSKVLPYLLDTLSDQTVKQKLGQATGLTTQVVDPLLSKWLKYAAVHLISLFRAQAFAESNKLLAVSFERFPDQFQAFRLLEKVATVITGFKFTITELSWLFEFRKIIADPSTGWLDLSSLPLIFTPAATSFESWERLVSLVQLRDALPKGKDTLGAILVAARQPGITDRQLFHLLADPLKWDVEDLKALVGANGLNLQFPYAYRDEVAITNILRAMRLIQRVGCSIPDGLELAIPAVSEKHARFVRQAVKSKYDQDTWNTVARPLQNILRDKQRAALVSYILTHPDRNQRKTWRSPNDIYAYFLMDVEQGPCALTSRIKQAIGAVQTFTQRCLLNLEFDVQADSAADDGWDEWYRYLKSFRLASANRQILCYPENYMEPSLRDDKSPFFKDLENDLQQNAVTQETAELAIANYLDNLDVVARLQVVSYYHQKEGYEPGCPAIDIMHVFARTRSTPGRYFYAKRVDGAYWTPWEKLMVDVTGDHLIPLVWNRRLHLFWALFSVSQAAKESLDPTATVSSEPSYYELKLAWSEFRGGKWTPKTISDKSVKLKKSEAHATIKEDTDNSWYTFRYFIDPSNRLRIVGTTQTHTPASHCEFVFEDVKSGVSSARAADSVSRKFSRPKGTREFAMAFQESADAELYLPNSFPQSQILGATPGGLYTVVFSPQYYDMTYNSPFFFQHDQNTFLVEAPESFDPSISKPVLAGDKFDPGHLAGGLMGKYVRVPLKPILPDIPRTTITGGPSKFLQSGEFRITASLPSLLEQGKTQVVRSQPFSRFVPFALDRSVKSDFQDLVYARPNFWDRFGIYSDRFTLFKYKFTTFYHPYVTQFIRQLNRHGIDGLYQRSLQVPGERVFFRDTYDPVEQYFNPEDFPTETVEFRGRDMYTLYNWELFFHVPMKIADQLSANQQFREAQKWYHYVFDPTDTSPLLSPQRFWRMGHFFNTNNAKYTQESLPNIMMYLARGASGAKLTAEEKKILEELEDMIDQWRKHPFNPFLIARTRTTAFQKMVVMKYLDNLIAWEISCSRETQLKRSRRRHNCISLRQKYSVIGHLKSLGGGYLKIEELISVGPKLRDEAMPLAPDQFKSVAPPSMLYFCLPHNPKLLAYWDTVADRLFKIRNCMNLQGIVRELALFEPPINPALLVKAAAAGVDLSSALSDANAPLSQYRYPMLISKAMELVSNVKELGRNFLEALEKRDAAALAVLQNKHEVDYLTKVTDVRTKAIQDAYSAKAAMTESRKLADIRQKHYSKKGLMNEYEAAHMLLEIASTIFDLADAGVQPVTAVIELIPDAKLGAPTSIGITIGGPAAARSTDKFGKWMEKLGVITKHSSSMASEMGSFHQRKDEWKLQAELAAQELVQIDQEIIGATLRAELAEKELDAHTKQLENQVAVGEQLRDRFTTTELYDWTISQLSGLYFQAYKMAYDAAKRAERAYCQEMGLDRADFIQFGHWDSLKRGLLVGERLHQDLLRLDSAYMEQNRREYEISQSVSLGQIDPFALVQLQTTGECFFRLSEAIFDVVYPGHFMRRLKSVSLTIPAITGPYTSVAATLSLLKSSVRTTSVPGPKYSRKDNNDARFRDNFERFDSICTSTAVHDPGIFELNFRDERSLPFEFAGAISSWRLTLPKKFRAFDYKSISDVILHVRYTAREGGEALRGVVETETREKILATLPLAEGKRGLARLLQLRREFPDKFYRMNHTPEKEMEVPLSRLHLPYFVAAAAESVTLTAAAVIVTTKQKLTGDVMASFRVKGQARGDGVQLAEVDGMLRAGMEVGAPWGEMVLTLWLKDGPDIPDDAFADVAVVAYYAAGWPAEESM